MAYLLKDNSTPVPEQWNSDIPIQWEGYIVIVTKNYF